MKLWVTLVSALLTFACSKAPSKPELRSGQGFADSDGSSAHNSPGNQSSGTVTVSEGYALHPIFRRISGVSYSNSVRDIFGLSGLDLSSDLPEDALINDFDNAIEQPMGASHIQSYLTLAKKVSDAALAATNGNRAKLFPCGLTSAASDPQACAKTFAPALLKKLFRRAPTDAEVDTYVKLIPQTAKTPAAFQDGLAQLIQSALLSPNFLYLVELGSGSTNAALSQYELAARLAYFIWSSAPDDELLSRASAGQLGNNEAIAAEVARMLDDPKADAFTRNFAGQWLGLRLLDKIAPDAKTFPSFDEDLRAAMGQESLSFFNEVQTQNLPIPNLVKSDFTFVNERLAKHYGISGVKGAEMKKVSIADGKRGGLITQAAMLTMTSAPDHTSIVKRGKWILGKLLCQQLPAPPANTPSFTPTADSGKTVREQFEIHASAPACNTCHSVIDPVGFGLESYDAIGAYRTMDGSLPVDTKGNMPGGATFNNADGLAGLIKGDDKFTRCVATKMVQFGLGRPLASDSEQQSFENLLKQAAATQYKLRDFIVAFVESDLFHSVAIIKE